MNSGKPIVIDTSAVLAVYLSESNSAWVIEQFETHADSLIMSTVNACEVLMLLRSWDVSNLPEVEERFLSSDIHFIPATIEHARWAAIARQRFPLNLGDCFAYALSVTEDCPILTLDEDFRRCDRPVIMPAAR